MKTLFIIILFCASLTYAADTNITSKVFEKHNKDGSVKFRFETVYRGKAKIMMVRSEPNKDGVMTVTARSFLVGGDLVMTEADDNRDGIFETIVIYHPGTSDMEAFIRQADGSVKPASSKTLEAYKQQSATVSKFVDTIFTKTNMTDADFEKLVKETQKKISDAEKENDDKK
jgi:hypothetical protein